MGMGSRLVGGDVGCAPSDEARLKVSDSSHRRQAADYFSSSPVHTWHHSTRRRDLLGLRAAKLQPRHSSRVKPSCSELRHMCLHETVVVLKGCALYLYKQSSHMEE